MTRQPKWQALVDWQTYYEALLQDRPGDTLIGHSGPLVGDELRQVELIDAIASGRKLITIAGFSGYGKSRLALELARRIGRDQRNWAVRFVRHDEQAVRTEVRDLPTFDRLILIVDDATLIDLVDCASASESPERILELQLLEFFSTLTP